MRWLLVVCTLGACVEPSVSVCTDGRICPASSVCDEVHGLCVQPEQLTSCTGLADGETCPLSASTDGECDAGVCIEQVCGDGVVTGTEDCDGATTADCTLLGFYDAVPLTCSRRCAFEPGVCTGMCGDAVINGPAGVEVCDGAPPVGSSCLDYGFEAGRLGCSSFCAPGFAECRDAGFVPAAETSGQHVIAAYIPAAGQIVFGETDAIVHVENGVTTRHPNVKNPTGLWGSSASNIWGVGYVGQIYHFDGTAWTKTTTPGGTPSLQDVWGSAADDVYAVGENLSVFHYDGTQWSVLPGATDFQSWRAIHGSSATNVYLVGGGGHVRRYNGTWQDLDASACWGSGTADFYDAVWTSGPTDVFAVGFGGVICHFDGVSWKRHPSGVTTNLYAVWGRSPTDVFAVGTGGVILHYDGGAWWRLVSDTTHDLYTVTGAGSELIVTGVFGTLRRYTGAALVRPEVPPGAYEQIVAPAPDHVYARAINRLYRRVGGTWVTALSYQDELLSMYVDPSGVVFVAQSDYQVARFDGVSTWTYTTLPFVPIAMAGRSPTDVYAVGSAGEILHYDGTWTPMTSTTSAMLVNLGVAPTRVYALGFTLNPLTPHVMELASGTWSEIPLPAGTPYLQGMYVAGDNDLFVAGEAGTLLRYNGSSWTAMDVGGSMANFLTVNGTGPNDVFATASGGRVFRYDGVAWNPIAATPSPGYFGLGVSANGFIAAAFDGMNTFSSGLFRSPGW